MFPVTIGKTSNVWAINIADFVNNKLRLSNGPVIKSKTIRPKTTGGIPIKVKTIFLVNLFNLKFDILINIPSSVPKNEATIVAKREIVKERNMIEYISLSNENNNSKALIVLSKII